MSERITATRANARIAGALRRAERVAPDDDKAFLDTLREYADFDATATGGGARPPARPATGGGARSLGLPATGGGAQSPGLGRQRKSRGARLDQDPRYLANVRELARRAAGNARIIGGSLVRGNEFDDCVGVGDSTGWGCTGTLIAPDVVLTAGHCEVLHTRVFIGNDESKRGRVFGIRRHVIHPRFSDVLRNDLMLLFLEKKVTGVKPRALASTKLIDQAAVGRVVGFGTTNLEGTRGDGIKRFADVPIVSGACRGRTNGKTDAGVYGCHAGLEIVAGKPLLQKDTCRGDSGGPFFIPGSRGQWLLGGVTSRGTDLSRTMCGDGGCYVRVDRYADWIDAEIKKYRAKGGIS